MLSCARDVNSDLDEDPYPQEVNIAFQTAGSFTEDVWYFLVFNYTAAPSVNLTTAPIDNIRDETRGDNWERYIALHREGGQPIVYTLQRPRVPTVLRTSSGPVHAAVGDFNADTYMDVAVACQRGGVVEWFEGIQTDAYDVFYFEEIELLSSGEQPRFLEVRDFNDDSFSDLLMVFAGADGASPFVRLLSGAADNAFTYSTDQALAALALVDYGFEDINKDGNDDLLLLGTAPGTETGAVHVWLGAGDGTFSAGEQIAVGTNPVALALGDLGPAVGEADGQNNLDLAVGLSAATTGTVAVMFGDGTGAVTTGPVLNVAGEVTGVSIDRMHGSSNDIVVSYWDGTQGYVGTFLSEAAEPLAADDTPLATTMEGRPRYLATYDTSSDNRPDAIMLEGEPGSNVRNLFIRDSDTVLNPTTLAQDFAWVESSVVYLSGAEPVRITFADVDLNGDLDMLVPNFADDENGNSLSLYYGLGEDNFTSVDIYWVDQTPELLVDQDWYIAHTVGRNFFDLTIDPGLFYDLSERPPDNFIFDIMTGTTGIALEHNPNREGIIIEHFSKPVNVPMTLGHYDDEQLNSVVNVEPIAIPAEDIDAWRVEVN